VNFVKTMAVITSLRALLILSMLWQPSAQPAGSTPIAESVDGVEALAADDVCNTSQDSTCSAALLQKHSGRGRSMPEAPNSISAAGSGERSRRLAPSSATEDLEACLKGPGSSPHTYVGSDNYGSKDYTGADVNMKQIHNARVTGSIQPSAIVFASEESHVEVAVSCAYQFGKPVSGRSGMNQYEPSCSNEIGNGAGCILIDTDNLMQVGWPSTGCWGGAPGCVVPLGPGLGLGKAYVELSRRGYTIPAGTCAQVRVAGLTLGGGKGWLTRKYGLTLDRLRGIDAVLLDGRKVHANTSNEEHLFWLARGGGGNIFPGVVTAFHFELVPMPNNPANYGMTWYNPSSWCRSSVLAQWYERMAKNPNLDLFSRATLSNWGQSPSDGSLGVEVVYYGSDKGWAKQQLYDLSSASGCSGQLTGDDPNKPWLNIVSSANNGATEQQLDSNNCGWDLSGPMPIRTQCYGFNTEFTMKWAYRSLVMGGGGVIPRGVWDTLGSQNMYTNFYVEIDPSNGATATVPSNATAYPHRDPGFITLQQNMRAYGDDEITNMMSESAEMMKGMTQYVPKLGYYNYLDKQMHDYGAIPRDAYYGDNIHMLITYLKEYTGGITNQGCHACKAWNVRPL
jgi:hypothetical protein